MNTEKAEVCIFCGGKTDEQHATSIGVVHIHSECLADLQEVLMFREEEKVQEQDGETMPQKK